MIAHLYGKILAKSPEEVVVDVGGVGYRVFCPLSTFYALPDVGHETRLHVHTHVRDSAIDLFGFSTADELALFKRLITVSGIGPKLGLNVLSGIGPQDFVEAVVHEDLARLTAAPGVGKKTAERMVLELRDKLTRIKWATARMDQARPAGGAEYDDALSALVNLGYSSQAAKKALDRVMPEAGVDIAIEELLRRALQVLAG